MLGDKRAGVILWVAICRSSQVSSLPSRVIEEARGHLVGRRLASPVVGRVWVLASRKDGT